MQTIPQIKRVMNSGEVLPPGYDLGEQVKEGQGGGSSQSNSTRERCTSSAQEEARKSCFHDKVI